MNLTLQDLAWHRAVGQLIETLDQPGFWLAQVRLLKQYVPFDSWVALLFSNGRPQVFAECPAEDGGPDPLFQDYLKGLYLLDPFYIASREAPGSGLFQLADVAPECFEQTDYYQRYFRLNVVADEVQFNVQLDAERTLCLSLGSKGRFSPEQVTLLDLLRPWVAGLMRQRMAFERELLEQATPPAPRWQSRLEETVEALETPLTARELEVGRLMLSGCSSKEIARKLAISAETVKVHRKHMYSKLGIKSQSELFSLFLQAQG
ncbi:LuxR C-terminal-related transcriptional regulator [Pseudomonas entomophila]|uniref:helix-turn-helix transcriptional regulator n=1 Tax=Pseudomonas entomophila TaxID=312306 RepID=UPI0023D7BB3F|nr:LuxR C-terminal-related transcriptional regulator [Pseudomonas entomophila]MDF0733052.1 LuxR C-terminal-related transcriptional regulator [Pseudomonas entomophila]